MQRQRSERAQTTVDFAIAMGVFLVAIAMVVAFVPSITQPFSGGQHNPLVADRLAVQLADYQLGDPASPSVLNATCTMYFFNNSDTPAEDCDSFENPGELTDQLGVVDRRFVNVTLQGNVTGDGDPEQLCADASWSSVGDCGANPNLMARGPAPPSDVSSITNARRKVLLDDRPVYIVVRVWS